MTATEQQTADVPDVFDVHDVEGGQAGEGVEAEVEALVGRIFEAGVATMELFAVELGLELGLYDVLAASHDPVTAAELADAAGIHPRYAREWLEQQTVAGLVAVDDAAAEAEQRRYSLPPATVAVLVDPHSLAHLAPFGAFAASLGQTLPKVVDAYRSGGGVSFGEYGTLLRDGQAALNRPHFETSLGEWVESGLPDIHARLAGGSGRVADLGCGSGWSSLAIAAAYPGTQVDGIDDDPASIEAARHNASSSGAQGVRFHVRDAAAPQLSPGYDLVLILEALHDMPQPVSALQAARELLAPGGAVLVMDERVADTFAEGIGNPVERFMYSASVVHCLPVGMSSQPSEGTGTIMRASTVRDYASRAGLTATVLPIEHDFWRFYRLDPSSGQE